MKRLFLKIGWGAAAVALLAFAPAEAKAGRVIEVHVVNNVFEPEFVEIYLGDTVRWVFDQGQHTATSVDGEFDTGLVDPGTVFEYRFTGSGQYDYYCTVHIDCCNMEGSIYVLPYRRPKNLPDH